MDSSNAIACSRRVDSPVGHDARDIGHAPQGPSERDAYSDREGSAEEAVADGDIVVDAEGPRGSAPPREMAPDEEQMMRLRAYDDMAAKSTMAFLLETRSAVVPSTITNAIGSGIDMVARSTDAMRRSVPVPIKSAAAFTGHQIVHFAAFASDFVDHAPDAVINAIPEVLMSRATKHLLFVDFVNVLRCFFHTNILSIPYVFRSAGLVGGLVLTFVVAMVSLYCTESFFAAKNQLREASRVFVYGDVPRMTWGVWYPSFNLFYGAVHVIGFLAFASSNVEVLLSSAGPNISNIKILALVIPPLAAIPLVLIKRAGSQRPLGVLSSILVLSSGLLMMAVFPYDAKTIALVPESPPQFFIALGVSVYAFTGIGSAVPVERAMSPRRYITLLRIAVLVAFIVLVSFGLSGFLSFGDRTCSVMTQSLEPGKRKIAVSAMLFVASVFIIPQQVFPLAELMDRRVLGIRHFPEYWELGPNLLRLGVLAGCAITAYVMPYYGLILAIAGAFGCGIIGIIVPAALDYVRRRRTALHEGRTLRCWEYLVCFTLGVFGVLVVFIGVVFGLFNLWINIQANSTNTC